LPFDKRLRRTAIQFLLINPPIHDFAAFDLWLRPLGLLTVARPLLDQGHGVTFIDALDREDPFLKPLVAKNRHLLNRANGTGHFYATEIEKPAIYKDIQRRYHRYGLPAEELRRRIAAAPEPDFIFLTCQMTYWYLGLQETMTMVREIWPKSKVVLGGKYATICPHHAQTTMRPDHLVCGDGMEALSSIIPGFKAEQVSKPPSLPRPAYELYGGPRLSAAITTSLGCPFHCTYCFTGQQGFFFQRPVAEVVEEITWLKQTIGVKHLAFYDDALLIRKEEHLLPILQTLAKGTIHPQFHTPNGLQARAVDEQVAQAFRQAPFKTVRLSFESTSLDRQRDSSHKVTNTEFKDACRHLFEAGYRPGEIEAYILIGMPGQTLEEVRESAAFVHDCGAIIRTAQFSPIPGTPDYERVRREYGLDLSEPLLQNMSVYPLREHALSVAACEALKEETRKLNDRLRGQETLDNTPTPG